MKNPSIELHVDAKYWDDKRLSRKRTQLKALCRFFDLDGVQFIERYDKGGEVYILSKAGKRLGLKILTDHIDAIAYLEIV